MVKLREMNDFNQIWNRLDNNSDGYINSKEYYISNKDETLYADFDDLSSNSNMMLKEY